MTVSTEVNITSGPYAGNDIADTFSYTFKVTDASQMLVYETDDSGTQTTLVLDTDYTVANIGEEGGLVTRIAGPLPTDYEWFIRSDYQPSQLTTFTSQGPFDPSRHEDTVDKLTYLILQINDILGRSPSVSESYTGDVPLTLDDPVSELLLRWKSDLTGLENISLSELSTGVVVDQDLSKIHTTVASMKGDTSVEVGKVIRTLEHTSGAGYEGGNIYLTRAVTGATDDNGSVIKSTGNPSVEFIGLFPKGINVKQFGAVGDGVVDDALAIQTAINYFGLDGGDLFFPNGDYRIDSQITVGDGDTDTQSTTQNLRLRGDGGGTTGAYTDILVDEVRSAARIIWGGIATSQFMFTFDGPMVCHIQGLEFDAAGLADGCLFFTHIQYSTFQDIIVKRFNDRGIVIIAIYDANIATAGAVNNLWKNIRIDGMGFANTTCLDIGNSSAPIGLGLYDVNRNTFENVIMLPADTGTALQLRHCDALTFISCFMISPSRTGVSIRVLPPTGNLGFPAEIVFINTAPIGPIVVDASYAPTSDRGIIFWPLNVGDRRADEPGVPAVPVQSQLKGMTTEFEIFNKSQLKLIHEGDEFYTNVTIFREYVAQSVSNTASRTDFTTYTVIGGTLSTDRKLRIRGSGGVKNDTGSNQNIEFFLRYGTTDFFDSTVISLPTSALFCAFFIESELNIRNNNDQQQSANTRLRIGDPGAGGAQAATVSENYINNNAGGVNEDSSVNQLLAISIQLGVASSDFIINLDSFEVDLI